MSYNRSKVKNQLFRFTPPRDVLIQLLECFGLEQLDDNRNFTRADMEKMDTITKINELKQVLEEYYLPCKARTYLNDITFKNVITILRQIVRLYGYSVISREKYMRGEKFIIYQLVSINERQYRPLNTTTVNKECILTFE
tara:strand:- start:479 stop:898 length:420 start_codon:yes stop_codon:yes gene_type:complete